MTLIMILINAFIGAPALNNANVSNEKVENVVKAPSNPTNNADRHSTDTAIRSTNMTNSKPIKSEPSAFTTSVP